MQGAWVQSLAREAQGLNNWASREVTARLFCIPARCANWLNWGERQFLQYALVLLFKSSWAKTALIYKLCFLNDIIADIMRLTGGSWRFWIGTSPCQHCTSLSSRFSFHGNLQCFSYGWLPVTPFGLAVKWFCEHHYYRSTFMSRAAWGWGPGVQNSAESQSVKCNGFFWLWWKDSARKITKVGKLRRLKDTSIKNPEQLHFFHKKK